MNESHRASRNGVVLGLSAYLIWGFLPLFLKALSQVRPLEILSHRIVWSMLLLAGVALLAKRWAAIVAAFRTPRTLGLLLLTALLIGANWLVYVWAVAADRVLDASLGYFINPLINVLLGMLFLNERLRRNQALAVALAALGVLLLAVSQGALPWVSLVLALTFGTYGLLRKMAPVDPLSGLFVETAVLAPVALFYIASVQADGTGSFGQSVTTDLLLAFSGVITAVPLLLHAAAAKRMRYTTLGLIQYITPSILFLQAVLLFGEPLTPVHMVTFACIWTALILYASDSAASGARASRNRAHQRQAHPER